MADVSTKPYKIHWKARSAYNTKWSIKSKKKKIWTNIGQSHECNKIVDDVVGPKLNTDFHLQLNLIV